MKKGIRPGTEKRCELSVLSMEKGYSASELLKLIKPMEGKSEEEKEAIAGELIEKMREGTLEIKPQRASK
jgi:hypothetical protein